MVRLIHFWTWLDVVTLSLTAIAGGAVCLAGRAARSGLTLSPILGFYELVASASMFLAALRPVPNQDYWFVWTYAGIGETLLLCFLSIELTAFLLPRKQFAQVWCGALAMLAVLSIGSVLPALTDAAIFNATLSGDCIAGLVLTVLLFLPGVTISRSAQLTMAGVLVPCGVHALYSFQWLHGDLSPAAHYTLPLATLAGMLLLLMAARLEHKLKAPIETVGERPLAKHAGLFAVSVLESSTVNQLPEHGRSAPIMAKKLLLALVLSAMLGCGSMAPTAVQAAAPTSLTCSAPSIFRGADDGVQDSIGIFSICSVNGSGNPTADVTFTMSHAFLLDDVTTWMGTNQNSIEEVAGEITIEVPTAVAGQFKILFTVTNQKDKHQDAEGERIEHYAPRTATLLPRGSRVVFHMNAGIINFTSNCPLGCGMQLNVYLNGHSESEGI